MTRQVLSYYFIYLGPEYKFLRFVPAQTRYFKRYTDFSKEIEVVIVHD